MLVGEQGFDNYPDKPKPKDDKYCACINIYCDDNRSCDKKDHKECECVVINIFCDDKKH